MVTSFRYSATLRLNTRVSQQSVETEKVCGMRRWNVFMRLMRQTFQTFQTFPSISVLFRVYTLDNIKVRMFPLTFVQEIRIFSHYILTAVEVEWLFLFFLSPHRSSPRSRHWHGQWKWVRIHLWQRYFVTVFFLLIWQIFYHHQEYFYLIYLFIFVHFFTLVQSLCFNCGQFRNQILKTCMMRKNGIWTSKPLC